MPYFIPFSDFPDVSLKVKQVVLPSFGLSFRVVKMPSSTVKQLVLLLRERHAPGAGVNSNCLAAHI